MSEETGAPRMPRLRRHELPSDPVAAFSFGWAMAMAHARERARWLDGLREGARVSRRFGFGTVIDGSPMLLEVTAISAGVVHCGPWTFLRSTGGEVDEVLGWDGVERYGSFIEPPDSVV